jgi:transcriptional regulator with XRE-family HTH domain
MSKTFDSPRHEALAKFVTHKRKKAGMTQAEVAASLGRYQSFIADIESGQRRIDVIQLLDIADAIGFDAREAIKMLRAIKAK